MLQIIPSTIRPLEVPWPPQGLTVEDGFIRIHIGGGTGVWSASIATMRSSSVAS